MTFVRTIRPPLHHVPNVDDKGVVECRHVDPFVVVLRMAVVVIILFDLQTGSATFEYGQGAVIRVRTGANFSAGSDLLPSSVRQQLFDGRESN